MVYLLLFEKKKKKNRKKEKGEMTRKLFPSPDMPLVLCHARFP
jgi:hypothetical protein